MRKIRLNPIPLEEIIEIVEALKPLVTSEESAVTEEQIEEREGERSDSI